MRSDKEVAALKRRRVRKLKTFGAWLLGITTLLVIVGFLGALIVLPIMSHYDDIEAKKRDQVEIEYKIFKRSF